MKPFIICLCDITGSMAEPWLQAGYSAMLVDPQHGKLFQKEDRPEGGEVWKIGDVANSRIAMYFIRKLIEAEMIAFVAGFPPCTEVAVSGARWWDEKRAKDPYFQAKAALVAEQCRTIGQLSGAPWFFENPVGAFNKIFGRPSHTFDPCDYGGYLPADDLHPIYPDRMPARDGYTKKTCLWSGGGFTMPQPLPVPGLPFQQAVKLGGKSQRTKNIRSATPRGFAHAVFITHHTIRAVNDELYGNGELTGALQCGRY